jgi:hypothetical protein
MAAHAPDYIVVLPWNLGVEIERQLAPLRVRGGAFVYGVPALKIQ